MNEGFVHPGFLLYKDCPNEQWTAVVFVTRVFYVPLKQALEVEGFDEHTPDFVTRVFYVPLKQALEVEGFDEHTPDIETGVKQMQSHYPDIALDTPVLLVLHLSVYETEQKHQNEIKDILEKVKNSQKKTLVIYKRFLNSGAESRRPRFDVVN